jgi:hypothetical protein
MKFPSLSEVECADRVQLCRWYRFLPSATSPENQVIQDLIYTRHKETGGFTPEISKMIGWSE